MSSSQGSIAKLSADLEARHVSPVELTESALSRAKSLDPEFHLFTMICEERALAMARSAEARIRAGARLGALDGVPITVKDLIAMKGAPTTNGAGAGWETDGSESSPVVANLERAGAVIIGKTNLHELGLGITNDNPHYGATQNPWRKNVSPGGSSGGSAAALALGIGFGSVGTDTGGSIRVPAAACGVFGLKPTFGRFSTSRVSGISWSLDHVGPMAASAADLEIMYHSMGGEDVRAVSHRDLRGLRIGVPTNYFTERAEAGVLAAYRAALDVFDKNGAVLIDVEVPAFGQSVNAAFTLAKSESALTHADRLKDGGALGGLSASAREFFSGGGDLTAADYISSLSTRERLRRELADLFDEVDVILAPATPAVAKPFVDETVVIDGEAEPMFSCMIRFTSPFNITGNPVVAAPCPILSDDMPAGVQLIGAAGSDERLLRIVSAYADAGLAEHMKRFADLPNIHVATPETP